MNAVLAPRNVDHVLDVGRKQTPNVYYIEHCTLQDVILVCTVGVAHAEGKSDGDSLGLSAKVSIHIGKPWALKPRASKGVRREYPL